MLALFYAHYALKIHLQCNFCKICFNLVKVQRQDRIPVSFIICETLRFMLPIRHYEYKSLKNLYPFLQTQSILLYLDTTKFHTKDTL